MFFCFLPWAQVLRINGQSENHWAALSSLFWWWWQMTKSTNALHNAISVYPNKPQTCRTTHLFVFGALSHCRLCGFGPGPPETTSLAGQKPPNWSSLLLFCGADSWRGEEVRPHSESWAGDLEVPTSPLLFMFHVFVNPTFAVVCFLTKLGLMLSVRSLKVTVSSPVSLQKSAFVFDSWDFFFCDRDEAFRSLFPVPLNCPSRLRL